MNEPRRSPISQSSLQRNKRTGSAKIVFVRTEIVTTPSYWSCVPPAIQFPRVLEIDASCSTSCRPQVLEAKAVELTDYLVIASE